MNLGDLVKVKYSDKHLGIIISALNSDKYYDVLIGGKICFCHESNLEVISESR
jgi:hypothetical protein